MSDSADSGLECCELLLAQARSGDRRALGRLLLRYRAVLSANVRRDRSLLSGEGIDGSGIVQETLWYVAQAIPDFRGETEAEFVVWLRQTLNHKLLDELRRNRAQKRDRRRQVSLDEPLVDGRPRGAQLADSETTPSRRLMLREQLMAAIEGIPRKHRQVISQYYLQERTVDEIAEDLVISSSEVALRLSRGLLALRAAIRNQFREAFDDGARLRQ